MFLLYVQATVSLLAFLVVVYAALPTKTMNVPDFCRASSVMTGVVLGAMAGSIIFDIFLPGTDLGYHSNADWLNVLLVGCIIWHGVVDIKQLEKYHATNTAT